MKAQIIAIDPEDAYSNEAKNILGLKGEFSLKECWPERGFVSGNFVAENGKDFLFYSVQVEDLTDVYS